MTIYCILILLTRNLYMLNEPSVLVPFIPGQATTLNTDGYYRTEHTLVFFFIPHLLIIIIFFTPHGIRIFNRYYSINNIETNSTHIVFCVNYPVFINRPPIIAFSIPTLPLTSRKLKNAALQLCLVTVYFRKVFPLHHYEKEKKLRKSE